MAGGKAAAPPRGAFYVSVRVLGIYLAAIVALNYFGVNHLFGNLPSPYRPLFMGVGAATRDDMNRVGRGGIVVGPGLPR